MTAGVGIDGTPRNRPRFSPSSFMRARRPEQFSDSLQDETPVLERSLFEYHLDTITSRSDEKPFEHFCRKLAQREICPNLIPQTGPTGGGDSKVDTETYPVADEIAERWYEGEANAASERWAFAISAKREWKPKARSDVKKIRETGRDYSRVYFMSNQFIKDKDRSDIEDALSSEHGVPVRILDRSWIVERVFERDHIALAIEALNIGVQPARKQTRTGPLDAERRAQLEELEAQIADQGRYNGVEYQLAEDCLASAILARELELGRVDVDGRLNRAERVATRVGHAQQRLRVTYQRAWTACCWFDDLDTVVTLYPAIEELALVSEYTEDIEKLSTLWTVVFSGVQTGLINDTAADLVGRTARLKGRLTELADQRQRPNNAAHARTILCTIDLATGMGNEIEVGRALQEFTTTIAQSERLGGYPFDQSVRIFEELGSWLGRHPNYDVAFEIILPIIEKRRGESAAGLTLLKKGQQKLEGGDYYDAIRLFGRAKRRLVKHEHRGELTLCLVASAFAYERVGLLWAAHSNLLAATSLALAEFGSSGQVILPALRSVQRLVWTELQLGRIPHVLTYLRLQDYLAAHLRLEEEERRAYDDERGNQDAVLGILLLRSTLEQLSSLERLPKTLENMSLYASSMALLFALGQEDWLIEDGYMSKDTPREELLDFFRLLADQPAKNQLPSLPELFTEQTVTLSSSALGCKWSVHVEANEIAVRIGEALLGFVETFFATSLGNDALPHRQHIRIAIGAKPLGPSGDRGNPLQMILGDSSFLLRVFYTSAYEPEAEAATGTLQNFLSDLVAVLIPRVLFVPDLEGYFARIAGVEEGFARSLLFSDVFTTASNVVGSKSTYLLSEWLDDQSFPLKRTEPVRFGTIAEQVEDVEPNYGVGDPSKEFVSADRLRHGQRRVLSLIDVELWDAAQWGGMAVILHPCGLPALALMFRDEGPARHIFEGWRSQFGGTDEEDMIHVTIVTGVDKHHPSSYVLVLSTNYEKAFKDRKPLDQAIVVSRVQRVDEPDPKNLQMLLSMYRSSGRYLLMAAVLSNDSKRARPLTETGILKRELNVRPAWQIGEHDPDGVALSPDDDPVIPEGVIDPPVHRALRRRCESDS